MKVFISYPEIQDIVFSKTGKNIVLSFNDDKTVTINHTLTIKAPLFGKIKKNVNANITVEEIAGMDIKLRYDMSSGMNMIFAGVRRILGDIINNSQLLSWGEDSKIIILHLDKIAEVIDIHNFNQLISHCCDISFKAEEEGILVSFNLQNL